MTTPAEVEASYPWTKPRSFDKNEFGRVVRVYLDSPSRLDAPEDAIKLAKQILRKDAKLNKSYNQDIGIEVGPVSIVESPVFASKPEWQDKDKNWKPFALYIGWYAVEKKARKND